MNINKQYNKKYVRDSESDVDSDKDPRQEDPEVMVEKSMKMFNEIRQKAPEYLKDDNKPLKDVNSPYIDT